MASPVLLEIDGDPIEGWEEVTITRSIESLAGSFSLQTAPRVGQSPAARFARKGDRCRVRLGSEVLLDGYVDGVELSLTGSDASVRIGGRDLAGDLVDCAIVDLPGNWSDVTPLELATEIAAPFGIPVRQNVPDVAPIRRFQLNPGETAFAALDRACDLRGLLPISDPAGGLLLTRAGSGGAGVAIVAGGEESNVLEIRNVGDDRQRFSRYVATAQGSDAKTIDVGRLVHIQAEAVDPGVRRYRPTALSVTAPATGDDDLEARAVWLANRNAARSQRVYATLDGWEQTPGGRAWAPNLRVPVLAEEVAVNQELLVAKVTLTIDDDSRGPISRLELVRPDAFLPEPLPPPASSEELFA